MNNLAKPRQHNGLLVCADRLRRITDRAVVIVMSVFDITSNAHEQY
ncbi:MAG: hypothetical protein ACXWIU_11035 [Limisphaerales bacterium]